MAPNIIRFNLIYFVIDFVIILIIAIPVMIFAIWGNATKIGFFCNDISIRFPDIDPTISRFALNALVFFLPILLIIGCELAEAYWFEAQQTKAVKFMLHNVELHRCAVRLYIFVGYFVFGIFFTQLITYIAKYTSGRLAPNFFAACKPDFNASICGAGDALFIEQYECTDTDEDSAMNARLAFFSGHASLSFFSAIYLSFYFQARFNRVPFERIILPFAQFQCVLLATYVSLTRISDYKHSLIDVIAGVFVGCAIALFVAVQAGSLFYWNAIFCGQYDDVDEIGRDKAVSVIGESHSDTQNTIHSRFADRIDALVL